MSKNDHSKVNAIDNDAVIAPTFADMQAAQELEAAAPVEAAPVVETSAPEAAAETPVEAAPVAETPAVETAAPETPEDNETPTERALRKRFGKLTAEKKALEAQLQAQQELLKARTEVSGETPGMTPEAIEAEVQRRLKAAQTTQAEQDFNRRANDSYQAGMEKYGDFEAQMTMLRDLGVMSRELIEAALASDAAPDVLHYLGKNPAEAERVATLSPVSLGVELAKMAQKVSGPKPAPRVSQAPAPITPIAPQSTVTPDLAKAAASGNMRDYVEQRRQQGSPWATPARRR